jgi:vesicle-fusing ATPase
LGPDCQIEELARLTKNFTGAEIEALVKCASSHSISRTTNILDFAKELIIDEKALRVERQDFLKALQEVRPQFGVDEEKFGAYFREKVVNYGPSFDRIMSSLQETALFGE